MATLAVRNLEDAAVRRLRICAAGHGRAVEAERREILRAGLTGAEQPASRQQAADRLAEFRRRIDERGPAAAAELLAESRTGGLGSLAGMTPDLAIVVDASVCRFTAKPSPRCGPKRQALLLASRRCNKTRKPVNSPATKTGQLQVLSAPPQAWFVQASIGHRGVYPVRRLRDLFA